MPKGVGNKKGKQPIRKPAPKRLVMVPSEPSDEGDLVNQGAILTQIKALEKAHSLPPGGKPSGAPGKKGCITRQASQQYFHSQVHLHLIPWL